MIVETAGGRVDLGRGLQFKTDEFNNLCILSNSRCVKVFAVNVWRYVEVELDD